MGSFTIATLGCKVNRYESEAIAERLKGTGWNAVCGKERADICIVNTCTVTGKAAMQSRQAVRRLIREHPNATVVVTGCYAQTAPNVFSSMPGVHYVVGNTFKDRIDRFISGEASPPFCAGFPAALPPGSCVEQAGQAGGRPNAVLVEDIAQPRAFADASVTAFGGRTRPIVKIQDGCDQFCAYCIVPHARGRSRSLAPRIVADRIGSLKDRGYLEVVLCGINLGRYGRDLEPATSLSGLIALIDGPKCVDRVRLSSIEPLELADDLIEQVALSGRVCPHLHIPLQSGDDEVLRSMNRHYRSVLFRDLVMRVAEAIPGVAIGVDVLVGFPGETDRAFQNTCDLIEQLPIAYLHVFPFSAQKGTPAARRRDPVPHEVIKARCRVVRDIGNAKRRGFYERFLGSTAEVLIEAKRDRATGNLKGLTRNYIPVLLKGPDKLFKRLVEVRLTMVTDGRIFGEQT